MSVEATKFKGEAVRIAGEIPQVGATLPDFDLVGGDLASLRLADFAGKRLVLTTFPSIDTGVCAAQVARFNKEASSLENTVVLCVSADLPFAFGRNCAASGLDNVVSASTFRSTFGTDYGLQMVDGPLAGLMARAVIVADEDGKVIYTEIVPEITEEPNYEAALAVL